MSLKAKGFRRNAIIYGVCAILSIVVKSLPFVFIFVLISALYVWLYFKHKDDAEHPLVKKALEERENRRQSKKQDKENQKEQKRRLNARLEEIEKDFEFDYGDEDEEDDEDYYDEDEEG